MRLLAVPGTAVWSAQSGLHGHELFKPLPRRQLFLLCMPAVAAKFFSLLCFLPARRHAFLTISVLNQAFHFTVQPRALTRRSALKRCAPQRRALATRDKLEVIPITEESPLSDHKQDEAFRVIDRRPFTAEGELRKEVVEEQEREAKREAAKIPAAPPPLETAKTAAPPPPAETPDRIPAFENLVRMLGSNAAMVLGAYADPRTGQPVIDPEAARELIDMLDALH